MTALTRWYHSLAIGFAVATWALAQPLYALAVGNGISGRGITPGILLLMLTYQALPTTVLFLLDRLVVMWRGPGKALRIYRAVLFSVAILVFLRQIQIRYAPGYGISSPTLMAATLLVIPGAVLALVVYAHRTLTRLFIYLSLTSVVLTALFVLQSGLLTSGWTSPVTEMKPGEESASGADTPVFILIFDELDRHALFKGGQIDPERFPHFSELAIGSAVFTNATTNYDETKWVIPTMMTGRWVPAEALDRGQGFDYRSYPGGMFGVLEAKGYALNEYEDYPCGRGVLCEGKASLIRRYPHVLVKESVSWLKDMLIPVSVQLRMAPLLDRVLPLPDYIHAYTLYVWEDFLASVTAQDAPGSAYYVHVQLPHAPYEFDRTGSRRASSEGRTTSSPEWERAYEEQVMFVDSLLGRFIEKLRAEGLYDKSLLLVTGDHGPRLDYRDVPEELFDRTASVPLFIHGPGVTPGFSGVDYQHIDFEPTILDLLALDLPEDLPGVSAFDSERPSRMKVLYASMGDLVVPYVLDEASGRWLRQRP